MDVQLVRANEEQLVQAWTNQHPSWGGGVPLEAFFDRERKLLATGMGKLSSMWVLVPTSDTSTKDILSSVELFRRPILYKRSANAKVVPAVGYSIASVFTPSQNRGKGYAGRMMRLLHDTIRRGKPIEGEGESADSETIVSMLYSDVGPDFYARHGPLEEETAAGVTGWKVQDLTTTRWTASAILESLEKRPTQVRPLKTADLHDIAKRDQELLASDLASSRVPAPAFAVLPTFGIYEWTHARAQHWCQHHDLAQPEIWGFSSGDDNFVSFTYDFKKKQLKVLRLRVAEGNENTHGNALIRSVAALAQQHGLEKIVVWNVPQRVLDALPEKARGETAERTDSLSAVKVYGGSGKAITWHANEDYAWC